MAGSRASAKPKAEEVEELSVEEQRAAQLGEYAELHESGAVLYTNDENYKQHKRIEDMKVQLLRARLDVAAAGAANTADIDQLKLDTQETQLRTELKAAQVAAKAAKGRLGADGILESVQAQRDAAQAAADAASSEGN